MSLGEGLRAIGELLVHVASDQILFPVLHLLFAGFLVYALARQFRAGKGEMVASVRRGEKSWSNFPMAYGLGSAIILVVVSLSERGIGHKVVVVTLDLVALLYLCFFNGWFRNKVLHGDGPSIGAEALPAGEYEAMLSHNGYVTKTVPFTIELGKTTAVEVKLEQR